MSLDLNKTCSFVSSVEANIRRLDFLGILTHDPEMCSHKSDMWCYLGLDFQSEAPTNIYIDSVSLHCSNVTSFVQCIFLFTSCVGDSSFGSGSWPWLGWRDGQSTVAWLCSCSFRAPAVYSLHIRNDGAAQGICSLRDNSCSGRFLVHQECLNTDWKCRLYPED